MSGLRVAYISKKAPTCMNRMVLSPNRLMKISVRRKYSVCIELSGMIFIATSKAFIAGHDEALIAGLLVDIVERKFRSYYSWVISLDYL